MEPVDFHADLRKNRDWVELEHELARYVRKIARERKVPTRLLVNEWIKERLESLQ
jgi:hypothetical protein